MSLLLLLLTEPLDALCRQTCDDMHAQASPLHTSRQGPRRVSHTIHLAGADGVLRLFEHP